MYYSLCRTVYIHVQSMYEAEPTPTWACSFPRRTLLLGHKPHVLFTENMNLHGFCYPQNQWHGSPAWFSHLSAIAIFLSNVTDIKPVRSCVRDVVILCERQHIFLYVFIRVFVCTCVEPYLCSYVCAYIHKEEDLSCVVGLCILHTSLLSDICVYQR